MNEMNLKQLEMYNKIYNYLLGARNDKAMAHIYVGQALSVMDDFIRTFKLICDDDD